MKQRWLISLNEVKETVHFRNQVLLTQETLRITLFMFMYMLGSLLLSFSPRLPHILPYFFISLFTSPQLSSPFLSSILYILHNSWLVFTFFFHRYVIISVFYSVLLIFVIYPYVIFPFSHHIPFLYLTCLMFHLSYIPLPRLTFTSPRLVSPQTPFGILNAIPSFASLFRRQTCLPASPLLNVRLSASLLCLLAFLPAHLSAGLPPSLTHFLYLLSFLSHFPPLLFACFLPSFPVSLPASPLTSPTTYLLHLILVLFCVYFHLSSNTFQTHSITYLFLIILLPLWTGKLAGQVSRR